MNRSIIVILSVLFASEIFAQSTAQPATKATEQPAAKTAEQPTSQPAAVQATESKTFTLADAQKAYVAGNWKDAVTAYEQVCPTLDENAKTECYLWNILALSQTGVAKDFSKAGKRLDSLIQKTNPQNSVYADLIMTKAQFQMYLGKYDNAAESLIHAIETSNENQKPVLQKICVAMQAKVKKENLNEACERLKNSDLQKAAQPVAAVNPAPTDENKAPTATAGTVKVASSSSAPASSAQVQPASSAHVQPVPAKQATTAKPTATTAQTPAGGTKETLAGGTKETPASGKSAAPAGGSKESSVSGTKETSTAVTKSNSAKSYWFLQLGAFGVKSNAEILVNNLKKRGIASSIEERQGETKTLFVVQTGNFESKDQAVDFGAQKLTPLNIEFRAMQKK